MSRRTRLDRFLGTEPGDDYDRRYVLYLLLIAVAGWALASYDFNLQLASSFLLPQIEPGQELEEVAT